ETGRRGDVPGEIADPEGHARKLYGSPETGMLDRHEESSLGEVRIGEQRLGSTNGSVRDAAELRALVELRDRVAGAPGVENGKDALRLLLPGIGLLELRGVDLRPGPVRLDPLDD